MTQAVAAKRKSLYRQLQNLTEEDLDRVSHYAAFLQYLEAQEDEEDIVWIEAHKDDPTVPLADALKALGLD